MEELLVYEWSDAGGTLRNGIEPVALDAVEPWWEAAGTLYIAEQSGLIVCVKPPYSRRDASVVLDLRDIVERLDKSTRGNDERGLLAMAVLPKPGSPEKQLHQRTLFVVVCERVESYLEYSGSDGVANPVHATSLYAFHISPNHERARESAIRLLSVAEPQENHNGGALFFVDDTHLMWGLGDGGGQGDRHGDALSGDTPSYVGFAQDERSYHGKLLELHVQAHSPVLLSTRIAHQGLRNPWRCSVDAGGNLYVLDVGEDRYESLFVVAPYELAQNFGWPAMEGSRVANQDVYDYHTSLRPDEPFRLPNVALSHGGDTVSALVGSAISGRHLFLADHRGALFSLELPWIGEEGAHKIDNSSDLFSDDNTSVCYAPSLVARLSLNIASLCSNGILLAYDPQARRNSIMRLVKK